MSRKLQHKRIIDSRTKEDNSVKTIESNNGSFCGMKEDRIPREGVSSMNDDRVWTPNVQS